MRSTAIALSVVMMLAAACTAHAHELVTVGDGYCRTSVNTAVFRNSALVTHGDTQYISYYDPEGYVTLGKRMLGNHDWEISRTPYKGRVKDAHNVISIGVDGAGFLHTAFDHHGGRLKYCRGIEPGSLLTGDTVPMTGESEGKVTYPEFYTLPGGDLLFAYRDGSSGNGNLVLNRYDTAAGTWHRVHDNLIDGEGERNAYWQIYVDAAGRIHLSWVWRETWLVETNHDMCYACSDDGGLTWHRSDGSEYRLPVTRAEAEIAWHIPQNSELINQTGMTADGDGHPYIATYWRDSTSTVPDYRLVWHDGREWRMETVIGRHTPFTLSGGGTKMIPVARPRIVCDGRKACYVFRDAERGSCVSVACTDSIGSGRWRVSDVTPFSVDAWEPNIDMNLWNSRRKLHIFVQCTHQGDGEKVSADATVSTPVSVLEMDF